MAHVLTLERIRKMAYKPRPLVYVLNQTCVDVRARRPLAGTAGGQTKHFHQKVIAILPSDRNTEQAKSSERGGGAQGRTEITVDPR